MGCQKFVLCLALLGVFGVHADDDEAGYNLPGGNFHITDEKEISELTEQVTEHLAKIGANDNSTNLEFVRIHSAIYRIVAGTLYEVNAEIKENDTPVNCTISFWEKPWLDFVKFDVNCGEEESHKYHYLSRPDPDDISINETETGTTTD